jgi:hypothetical protein
VMRCSCSRFQYSAVRGLEVRGTAESPRYFRRHCIDDRVAVEVSQRCILSRVYTCRCSRPRARPAPRARWVRVRGPQPFCRQQRSEAVDVGVVRDDRSVHVDERVHRTRSPRVRRWIFREAERVFLERCRYAEAARLAAEERVRDLVEALDRRDRVRRGHLLLAEAPVCESPARRLCPPDCRRSRTLCRASHHRSQRALVREHPGAMLLAATKASSEPRNRARMRE